MEKKKDSPDPDPDLGPANNDSKYWPEYCNIKKRQKTSKKHLKSAKNPSNQESSDGLLFEQSV